MQFKLFLDDQQIIRCKGRVSIALLSEESKNPAFLPSKHSLTNLIIQDVHSKIKHSGFKDTLTTIRERFWVPRGREVVKQILRKTATCRRVGATYRPPPTSDLPMERVSLDLPFAHTGLDFIGPLYICDGKKVFKRERLWQSVHLCIHMRIHKNDSIGTDTFSGRWFISVSLPEVCKSPGITSHPYVWQCQNLQIHI